MKKQVVYCLKDYRREENKKKFSVFKFGILFMLGLVSLFMESLVMFGVFMGMATSYIFYRAWKNAKEYNEKWLEPPKPTEEIEKTYTQIHYPQVHYPATQFQCQDPFKDFENSEPSFDLYTIREYNLWHFL